MKLAIHETQKSRTFIAVPEGNPVPETVAKKHGTSAKPWKTIDVEPGKPRIALDPKVLVDIRRDGFAVLGAGVQFD